MLTAFFVVLPTYINHASKGLTIFISAYQGVAGVSFSPLPGMLVVMISSLSKATASISGAM